MAAAAATSSSATHLFLFFFLSFGCCCFLDLSSTHKQSVQFGYGDADGPSNWWRLSQNFSLCSVGKHQSPIDVETKSVVYDGKLAPLEMNYVPTNATLINNVFNVALQFDNGCAGTVTVDGKKYSLRQVHWHQPSEHTIDGVRYPVEFHMVHYSVDRSITVVAALYRYGDQDPFIAGFKDELAKLAGSGAAGEIAVGELETKRLKGGRRSIKRYLRYPGSLTTPPCTENVIWHVLDKAREMSAEQAAALSAPLATENKKNSRPTQPLNGRTVKLYIDGRKH